VRGVDGGGVEADGLRRRGGAVGDGLVAVAKGVDGLT